MTSFFINQQTTADLRGKGCCSLNTISPMPQPCLYSIRVQVAIRTAAIPTR